MVENNETENPAAAETEPSAASGAAVGGDSSTPASGSDSTSDAGSAVDGGAARSEAESGLPDPGVEGAAAQAAEAEGKVKPKAKAGKASEDWRDKRLAALTAKTRALEQQLAEAKAAPQAEANPNHEAEVRAEAQRLRQVEEFNAACNKAVEDGRAEFPDFDAQVSNLKRVVDTTDPASQASYNQMLDAMLSTGEAPKLIYELGRDLNEANRIMGLTPARMGVELAKLASKTPAPVTNAPKPISPIGQRGASHTQIDPRDTSRADQLSTAEWMARRNAQVRAKAQA